MINKSFSLNLLIFSSTFPAGRVIFGVIDFEYKFVYFYCFSNLSSFQQDEIEQVILVGGSTRVPMVQEVLLKAVGK